MALYHPYCTVSDVTGHTKNSDISTGVLENSINMASRLVEEYTCRFFHSYEYTTEYYKVPSIDYIGEKYIYLPFPIIRLDELSFDSGVYDPKDYTFSVRPAKYTQRSYIEVEKKQNIDFLGQDKTKELTNPQLKGLFGFTATTDTEVPDDIHFPAGVRRATLLIASAFTEMNRKEQVTLDGDRTSIAEYRIPEEAKHILSMHKKKVIV